MQADQGFAKVRPLVLEIAHVAEVLHFIARILNQTSRSRAFAMPNQTIDPSSLVSCLSQLPDVQRCTTHQEEFFPDPGGNRFALLSHITARTIILHKTPSPLTVK